MFISNVSSKFLYFVGKVFDENTGKVSTRVNGWQYLRWMSIDKIALLRPLAVTYAHLLPFIKYVVTYCYYSTKQKISSILKRHAKGCVLGDQHYITKIFFTCVYFRNAN